MSEHDQRHVVMPSAPTATLIVIQSEFLRDRNYPEATALAFVLMAIMLVGAVIYARLLGTARITEA